MSNSSVIDKRNFAMIKAAYLLSDMAIYGATQEELERAILYSADIVRAGKHNVDWKQSYEDYVIAELEDKYLPQEPNDWNKKYLVLEEQRRGMGQLIAGFDTMEEAEAFVKETDLPNLVIFGTKETQ